MDKMKNLGWPYNLYSAITGISVPDVECMKTRSYLYKYQRGYYCFFMIPPDRAHWLMNEYIIHHTNETRLTPRYGETILVYKDYIYRLLMYIVLVHRYAYNRSYDEILYMFHNDLDSFASCLSDTKSIMSLLKSDITYKYKRCNKQQLHRYEVDALNSLRKNPAFNTYFLDASTWNLAGLNRPRITEHFTVNDKIRLYSLSHRLYNYNRYFSIDCNYFNNNDLQFDTELYHIIKHKDITDFLVRNNIFTIGDFCKLFNSNISKLMYQNDVVILFGYLKESGIIVHNDFYTLCIRKSIIEKVSKKKFSKRIVYEVKFITTYINENKKDGDKKERVDQETALKTIIERAQREKNNRERYRYYQKLLLESRENEVYPNYSDIVYYIDKLIPFVREYMNKSKPIGYKSYNPYRDYGFIDGDNIYINISGIYADICSEYLDEFGYEFPLSEYRVLNLLVREGAMSRVQLDLPEWRKSTRKYRKTYKTTYGVTEDSLIWYRDNLIKGDTSNSISIRRVYRADPNYHRGNKPQYIDTFSDMTTLRDIEDYYDTPEYIDAGFLETIGIYCELPQYDQ